MTAEEQMETNNTLTALGISPLIMPAIPIFMMREEDILKDATQGKPIQILSDSE